MLLGEPSSPENAMVRAKWTEAEDEALLRLVREAGSKMDWTRLASCIPGRTESVCRERWVFCLIASAKKNSWANEEDLQLEHHWLCVWTWDDDEALERLHAIHGNSWGRIARQMSGHSHLQCRHR